jgi:hypothetical protein
MIQEGGFSMRARVFLVGCVVLMVLAGGLAAGTPVTSGSTGSAAVVVDPASVASTAPQVRAVARDAQGQIRRPPVLAVPDGAAASGGPLVAFEVDPTTGEIRLISSPTPVNQSDAAAKTIISGNFAVDSITCTNCTGCPPLGDRTLVVTLRANVYMPGESYGVSDLTAANYSWTGVSHGLAELFPGDLLPITISGDVGVCDTFRVFFDMCDTPSPVDPTAPCPGNGGPCPPPSFLYAGYCWVRSPAWGFGDHAAVCATIGKAATTEYVSVTWDASALAAISTGMGYTSIGVYACCANSMWCNAGTMECGTHAMTFPDVSYWNYGEYSDSNWIPVFTCVP